MGTHNWHDDAFFGLHYDIHAVAQDTGLGAELAHQHLRERLERVRPDWVQCDCKGHPGYTTWPTEIGSPSPGIVTDALRIHRDVTRDMGIRLAVHYSGVYDTRAIELHPEWGRVRADGSRDPNMTCRLAGYTEQLMIPQMLEIVARYDVDGFWVDGENWASAPCWCALCSAEFARRTGVTGIPGAAGEPHWFEWLSFHRDLFTEYVTAYSNAVHAVKPDCLICSNWLYASRQPEPTAAPIDRLSADFAPSWGADCSAVEGRAFDARGITWDLMAWSSTRPAGTRMPWATKSATHLCQELAEVVALGGAVMIVGQLQCSGRLISWHQDTFAEVAAWCRERQALCRRTQTASEAAVLHLASHYYTCNLPLFAPGGANAPVEGALQALLECGISTDIVLEHDVPARLEQYKLVVVPDQTHLTAELKATLGAYAEAGGCVLLTGAHVAAEAGALAGVAASTEASVRAKPVQVDRVTDTDGDHIHLPSAGKTVPVLGPWQPVRALAGTDVWTRAMDQQEPGQDETMQAAVTARRLGKGWVVAAHGPLFRNYLMGHYPLLRRFISELVARLEIAWTVRREAPAHLELVSRRRDGQLLVNLINRGAAESLSPSRVLVEELAPVENVRVRVRCESAPAGVTAVGADVQWTHADGELTITVPRVEIHCVIAVAWGHTHAV